VESISTKNNKKSQPRNLTGNRENSTKKKLKIIERCLLILVNEGSKILEESVARQASDTDIVYV